MVEAIRYKSQFSAVQASEMISGTFDFWGRQPSSDRMRAPAANSVTGLCAAGQAGRTGHTRTAHGVRSVRTDVRINLEYELVREPDRFCAVCRVASAV